MEDWNITKTLYKISDFISWQKAGSLNLSPNFQRRPVWKPGSKSYLIDTIIKGLPIPIIFLREKVSDITNLEPVREVVDGQQRIRTIISFIAPRLLKDFKSNVDYFAISKAHNPEYSGISFSMLPIKIQQKILDYQFSVHIFPSHTDDRDIYQIFARLNSTGVKLNHQELRNAQFFGAFKTLVYNLALEQLDRWRSWHIFTEDNIARMAEAELASEFIIMMFKGLGARSQSLINFYYKTHENSFDESEIVADRFRHTMDALENNLKENIKTYFSGKTMIYSIFALFYDRQYKMGANLKKIKPLNIDHSFIKMVLKAADKILNKLAPQDVLEATARRTTHLKSRKLVYEYLKNNE